MTLRKIGTCDIEIQNYTKFKETGKVAKIRHVRGAWVA